MSKLHSIATILLLATLPVLVGCEKQSSPPAPSAGSGINDSGTGNAPNTGDGEPSAAG